MALDAGERVEGVAGGIDADLAPRFLDSGRLRDEREDERLRHAHDGEFVVRVARLEHAPGRPHDADAEEIRRDAGQGGVNLGHGAVLVVAEFAVGEIDQFADALGIGQPPG